MLKMLLKLSESTHVLKSIPKPNIGDKKLRVQRKKRNFSFVDIHPMRDDSCENKYPTVNRPSCQRQQPQRIVT